MKYIFILFIDLYSKFISPLFPAKCRFYPTCSTYGKSAFIRFGFIKGLYLSIKRILKCNPFHKGGFDYLPEKFHF